MTIEEREEFVKSFYQMATANGLSTLTDISNSKAKFIIGILKSGKNRKVVFDAIIKFIKEKNAIKTSAKKVKKTAKKTKPTNKEN